MGSHLSFYNLRDGQQIAAPKSTCIYIFLMNTRFVCFFNMNRISQNIVRSVSIFAINSYHFSIIDYVREYIRRRKNRINHLGSVGSVASLPSKIMTDKGDATIMRVCNEVALSAVRGYFLNTIKNEFSTILPVTVTTRCSRRAFIYLKHTYS